MAVIHTGLVPKALAGGSVSYSLGSQVRPEAALPQAQVPSQPNPSPKTRPQAGQSQGQPQRQSGLSSVHPQAVHRLAQGKKPHQAPSRSGSLLATIKRLAQGKTAGHNCGGPAFHRDGGPAFR